MLYLDYASTTPIDKEVLDTYIRMQNDFFANPASIHKLGLQSNYMLQKAKDELKSILNIPNHEIVFTSNATEANNLAIYGIVNKYKTGKIITSKIEHPSIKGPMHDLANRGYNIVYLDVDSNGIIDLEQLANELDKDTILVSLQWVNNIIGSIQPIDKVISLVEKFPRAKLLVDAVQGICKTKENFKFNDLDIFTFSAHKIYGPKGVGCLIYKNNIELQPILFGSTYQKGVKPGTIDIALNVACVKAVKKYFPLVQDNNFYVQKLYDYLYDSLKDNPKIIINSKRDYNSPYIFNISVPSINSETLLRILESNDIYVSAGSACSAKAKVPEPTVFAQTNSEVIANHTIRISLSTLVKKDDLEKLIKILNSL